MLGTLVNIDLISAQRLPNMFAGRWALSRSNERLIKPYLSEGHVWRQEILGYSSLATGPRLVRLGDMTA